MPNKPPQSSVDASAVEAAFAQVLQAEQAARVQVQADEEFARRTLEAAQARASGIAERAARRTARIHEWADAHIARELARIAEQRQRLGEGSFPPTDGAGGLPGRDGARASWAIESAVARLAAELTGDAE